MKPPSATKPGVTSTKQRHRLPSGSLFGWVATQFLAALQILASTWSGRRPNRNSPPSIQGNASLSETSASVHHENATSDLLFAGQSHAENAPADALHLIPPAATPTMRKHSSPFSESNTEAANPRQSLERATFKPPIVHTSSTAFQTPQASKGPFVQANKWDSTALVQVFHTSPPQPGSNAVTRDELKRELDTLRRFIESRK